MPRYCNSRRTQSFPVFFPPPASSLNKRVLFLQKMARLVNNIVPGIVSLYVGSYALGFAFRSCMFSTFFPPDTYIYILYFRRSDILKTQSLASRRERNLTFRTNSDDTASTFSLIPWKKLCNSVPPGGNLYVTTFPLVSPQFDKINAFSLDEPYAVPYQRGDVKRLAEK